MHLPTFLCAMLNDLLGSSDHAKETTAGPSATQFQKENFPWRELVIIGSGLRCTHLKKKTKNWKSIQETGHANPLPQPTSSLGKGPCHKAPTRKQRIPLTHDPIQDLTMPPGTMYNAHYCALAVVWSACLAA